MRPSLAGLEHWDQEWGAAVLEPMLASTGAIAAPVEDWAFEPKLDDWRAMVYVDDTVTVRTRNARDVAVSLPTLASSRSEHANVERDLRRGAGSKGV